MISSSKRTIQSPTGIGGVSCNAFAGQGPGITTPFSQNTSKKKQKKEQKKTGFHSRKLSDNRIIYHHNNIVIANGNIIGPAVANTNGNLIMQSNNINYINPSNNLIGQNNNNIPNNHNINNIINHPNFNQPNPHYHSNENHISNHSPSSQYQHDDETGSSDSNLDIKNKLLSLLTQKNDCKKLIASKSSGNSLDFAIGEFGRRKKSPKNLVNNYNIGGMANNHYHLGKKSPSKMKNLLYFQEKTTNKSQIQNNSSTHFILSPKETKNIQNVFSQIKPQKKEQYLQLYQPQQYQYQTFSPLLNTIIKSKGLSPEKKDSLSPSRENLKNIIAAQKYINHGVSPSRGTGGGSNSSGNLIQVESNAAFKKKLSVPKPLNQEMTSYLSKRNDSKEKIINLFNTKQEALTDHNTRKSSTVSKKHKSVSPENQQQVQKNIKKAISNNLQQQLQTTQKQKPLFKKYRPKDLDEVHSTNTISQSVPNSSKHVIQNTFNTPINQNINNPHPHVNASSSHNETKKFHFDSNIISNSQLINSQTINPNKHAQNIKLNNINTAIINNSINNPNIYSSNPNNLSNSVNYSHSARSNNQISSIPYSNPLYQNYLNPYININNPNQTKIITAAINQNLKNAENRLMKIQEDMYEGGEQSNILNEQLQKTFLRTSKLLSGYKTRELRWEQEKRALVDEIKFLKNLLYTEQFDDLVINNQLSCFIYYFYCFAFVICSLCA